MSDIKEWEEKPWGRVAHVVVTPCCIVSHLEVEAGGFSSTHFHNYRTNLFVVVSGKICVETFGEDKRRYILGPGDTAFVKEGVSHRFEVIESGFVVEVYGPPSPRCEVSLEDIERSSDGGRREILGTVPIMRS